MSISSVSNSTNLQSSQMSDAFKQRKQDFAALANALQSGDIAGAQKAFASLQQDKLVIGQAQGGQGSNSSAVSQSGTTSMQDLMNQLKQALGSGDLQGAQQAFASIQQNMQANQSQGHHHHHHHGGGSQPTPTSATSTGNTASPSGTAQAGGISTTA